MTLTPTPNPYDPHRAEYESLQAQYEAHGHRLRRAFNGRTGKFQYVAHRPGWPYSKLMRSLDEVCSFLQQIGGER